MSERKNAEEFPQEVWDTFDRYVHGEMDRRAFLEYLQKFAVGGLTAAALFDLLRPNYAWAIQVPENDRRIKTETLAVNSPKGNGGIKGYLAMPAKPNKKIPAVLVVHENRGLNPYIKDVARRLAAENFLAFAPDGLTSAGGYPGDDEKGGELFKTIDREKMTEDFLASAQTTKSRSESNGKLAVVGFCFGGGIANTLAVRMGPELHAAVPFYGAQPESKDVARIKASLLIHDAGLDSRIMDGWPAYETALKANHVRYTHHTYPNVNHGFHNDTTPRYDAAAAKLAWTRTLEFLGLLR